MLPFPMELRRSTAPTTSVLAVDMDFHEFIPQLFPTRAHARERYAGEPDLRERHARFNASLQAGYFVLAVRAVGLAAGPMAGFDAAGVDGEFFADSTWRSIVVINIGEPYHLALNNAPIAFPSPGATCTLQAARRFDARA